MVFFSFQCLDIRNYNLRSAGGMKLNNKISESKMIERIIEEKVKKQQRVLDLDMVDDDDLLDLIRQIKDEPSSEPSSESQDTNEA